MLWRLTSSKKTPSPWTSRLSSLRGTFCPLQVSRVGSSTAVCSGATVVSLIGRPPGNERGRGKPARSEWEVPPHLWRRGLVGETGFPPRERAEGERRSCGQPLLQLVEGNLDVLRPGRPDR